ncbi:MAG TPA: hypothetical protein GXX19_10705 [Syntrophomonadaceae bacterium]|nr:hypothetical protein [Syntrophomonadaceae bacterium]
MRSGGLHRHNCFFQPGQKEGFPYPRAVAFLAVTSLALGYKLLGKTGIEGIGAACLLAQSLLALIVFRPLWRELRGRKALNKYIHASSASTGVICSSASTAA